MEESQRPKKVSKLIDGSDISSGGNLTSEKDPVCNHDSAASETKETIIASVTDVDNLDLQSSEKISQAERICAICMETEPIITFLESHNCSICVKTAWDICVKCEPALLSRLCPVCKGDYKALQLHGVPGLPSIPPNFASYTDPRERFLQTMKLDFVVKSLITGANTAVWTPSTSQLHLSLPQDMSVPVDEMSFLVTTIPITSDRIVNGNSFAWTNQVWDEIEVEVEKEGNDTIVDAKGARQFLLKHMMAPDHVFLTPMTPAEWADVVDNIEASYNSAHIGAGAGASGATAAEK